MALADVAWLPAGDVPGLFSSTLDGLTDGEVALRRAQVGRNEVAHEKAPAWYIQLGRSFATPFNIVLAILAGLSGISGDRAALIVIGMMVALSTGIRFVQEFRSNKSAESLRAMVRTRATVERAGDAFARDATPATGRRELPMDELVPGDIVYLSAGDMVPGDVRLLVSKDVFVSQAALTGEALPVEKHDHADKPAGPSGATDLPTVCFMGTSVVSGTATAIVVATGSRTMVGGMAKTLVGQRATTASSPA